MEPNINNKNPKIFKPNIASFLSPKLKYFFTIGLASYINLTPQTSDTIPINSKNILNLNILFFLKINVYIVLSLFPFVNYNTVKSL